MFQESPGQYPTSKTQVHERTDIALPKLDQEAKFSEILKQLIKDFSSLGNISEDIVNDRSFCLNLKNVQLEEDSTKSYSILTSAQALEQVKDNPFCYLALPQALREDKDFCLLAMRSGVELYSFLPESLQKDQTIINLEFKKGISSLDYVSDELLGNKEYIKKILFSNPALYSELSEDLKHNKELTTFALSLRPGLVKEVPLILLKDKEVQIHIAEISLASERHLKSVLGEKVCSEANALYDCHRKAVKILSLQEGNFNWHQSSDPLDRGNTFPPNIAFNLRQIVQGRYLVGDQNIKNQLDGIYGKAYLEVTDKPATIFFAHKGLQNQISLQANQSSRLDDVGIKNQIIYFEVGDKASMLVASREAFGSAHISPKNLFMIDHGSQFSMTLTEAEKEMHPAIHEQISIIDREFQKELTHLFPPDMSIYLISCATGKGELFDNSIDNMAEYFHGIEPRNLVFAPKDHAVAGLDVLDEDYNLIAPKFESKDGSVVETLTLGRLKIYSKEDMSGILGQEFSSQLNSLSNSRPGLLFGRKESDSPETLKAFYFGKQIYEPDMGSFSQKNLDELRQSVEREIIRETIVAFSAHRYPDEKALSFNSLTQFEKKELIQDLSLALGKKISSLDFTFGGDGLTYNLQIGATRPTEVALEPRVTN